MLWLNKLQILNISNFENKVMKEEETIQLLLSNWVRTNYPDVLFNVDMSGVRLPISIAKKMKRMRSGRAWPDMFIAHSNEKYCGLFIEIKKNRDEVYTKAGKLRESKHIQEQAALLVKLITNGYAANFGCGLEDCKNIVRTYMKL